MIAARAGLALCLFLATAAGHAQQRPRPAPPAPAAPAAPPQPQPGPSYEPMLLRLAEILGAVSYLASLCQPEGASPGAAEYRTRMRELLESEGQNEALRDRLAGAFNRGVTGYEAAHAACTPASRLALDRLIAEGARLSHEIAARFGA